MSARRAEGVEVCFCAACGGQLVPLSIDMTHRELPYIAH